MKLNSCVVLLYALRKIFTVGPNVSDTLFQPNCARSFATTDYVEMVDTVDKGLSSRGVSLKFVCPECLVPAGQSSSAFSRQSCTQ